MSGSKSEGSSPVEIDRMLGRQKARQGACHIVTTHVVSTVISLFPS